MRHQIYPVLGLGLTATNYSGVEATVDEWLGELSTTPVRAVGAANTHFVTLSRRDAAFRRVLESFDMVVPDGMPLVWVMNRSGAQMADRVYGPEMMLRVLARPGLSHFLLGGSEEMLERLQQNLRQKFPELHIAGAYSPPFGPWPEQEDAKIRALIADSGANITWVGLGCPKQEMWIAKNKPLLSPGIYFAVGAAFPFHSGLVKQAPGWMQRAGLEWIFRLLAEPRRLWKRYAVYNTLFLSYLALDALRGQPGKAKT